MFVKHLIFLEETSYNLFLCVKLQSRKLESEFSLWKQLLKVLQVNQDYVEENICLFRSALLSLGDRMASSVF